MPDPSGSTVQLDNPENAAAPPTPPRNGFSFLKIFIGQDGLRAIWGILLFLVLRQILVDSLTPLLSRLLPHPADGIIRLPRLLAYEGIALVSVAIPTSLMARIEHRPASLYGLGGDRPLRRLFSGIAWGTAILSLLVFTLRAAGLLVFDLRLLSVPTALHDGALWFAGFLMVGLFEEFFFRGYLQFTLARGCNGIYNWLRARDSRQPDSRTSSAGTFGFWTAALLLSFGFSFTHSSNAGESPIGLLSAALIAVVFCLSLWRTGSLWWAIGFHAAWDWAQSFLYGVADSGIVIHDHLFATHPTGRTVLSGGLTGPEGSLFILPVVGLTAAVVVFTLPCVHRDAPPAQRDAPPASTRGPALD